MISNNYHYYVVLLISFLFIFSTSKIHSKEENSKNIEIDWSSKKVKELVGLENRILGLNIKLSDDKTSLEDKKKLYDRKNRLEKEIGEKISKQHLNFIYSKKNKTLEDKEILSNGVAKVRELLEIKAIIPVTKLSAKQVKRYKILCSQYEANNKLLSKLYKKSLSLSTDYEQAVVELGVYDTVAKDIQNILKAENNKTAKNRLIEIIDNWEALSNFNKRYPTTQKLLDLRKSSIENHKLVRKIDNLLALKNLSKLLEYDNILPKKDLKDFLDYTNPKEREVLAKSAALKKKTYENFRKRQKREIRKNDQIYNQLKNICLETIKKSKNLFESKTCGTARLADIKSPKNILSFLPKQVAKKFTSKTSINLVTSPQNLIVSKAFKECLEEKKQKCTEMIPSPSTSSPREITKVRLKRELCNNVKQLTCISEQSYLPFIATLGPNYQEKIKTIRLKLIKMEDPSYRKKDYTSDIKCRGKKVKKIDLSKQFGRTKSQGVDGICYSFSAISLLEAAYYRQKGTRKLFSEHYVALVALKDEMSKNKEAQKRLDDLLTKIRKNGGAAHYLADSGNSYQILLLTIKNNKIVFDSEESRKFFKKFKDENCPKIHILAKNNSLFQLTASLNTITNQMRQSAAYRSCLTCSKNDINKALQLYRPLEKVGLFTNYKCQEKTSDLYSSKNSKFNEMSDFTRDNNYYPTHLCNKQPKHMTLLKSIMNSLCQGIPLQASLYMKGVMVSKDGGKSWNYHDTFTSSNTTTISKHTYHAMTIQGVEVENNIPYLIFRNSWSKGSKLGNIHTSLAKIPINEICRIFSVSRVNVPGGPNWDQTSASSGKFGSQFGSISWF